MKFTLTAMLTLIVTLCGINTATAAVVSSNKMMAQQQSLYNKEQLLQLVDSQQVQAKLVSLGVNIDHAKLRIANMTDSELSQFHNELNDLPAGQGIAGTIVTVLLVIAVLDLLGVTDVYPFIRPIRN